MQIWKNGYDILLHDVDFFLFLWACEDSVFLCSLATAKAHFRHRFCLLCTESFYSFGPWCCGCLGWCPPGGPNTARATRSHRSHRRCVNNVPTLQNQTGTVNWQMCITTWEGSEMWNETKPGSSWHLGRTVLSISSMIYDDLWCFPWREALCFYVLVCSGRAIYVFSVAWQFRFRPAEARRRKTCLLNQRRSLCSCQGGPFLPSFSFVAGIGQLIQQIEHVLSTSVGFARIWSFSSCLYIFLKCGVMWCRRFAKQLLKSLERLYLCWNSVNIGRMARWWHGVPVWMVATAAGCTSCWRVEVSGTEAWKQSECICEVRKTVDFCSTKV